MTAKREIKEGRQYQGADERIAYTLTTTPWGTAPGAVVIKLWDVSADPDMDLSTAWTDVSLTKLSGAPSVLNDVITTPAVISLLTGKLYRLEIQFVCLGNTFEAYAVIQAQP